MEYGAWCFITGNTVIPGTRYNFRTTTNAVLVLTTTAVVSSTSHGSYSYVHHLFHSPLIPVLFIRGTFLYQFYFLIYFLKIEM